jgi:carbonic anhydrase
MEKHYVFIKNNRVENTLVFTERNDALAQTITNEQSYDSFVWLDNAIPPIRWSTYNGSIFTPPTNEYLLSIGILTPLEDN